MGTMGCARLSHPDAHIRDWPSPTGRVQMGSSKDDLDFEQETTDDWVVLVPAGTWHNIANVGSGPLKIYSIYTPPEHAHGTVHETKAEADAAAHHH